MINLLPPDYKEGYRYGKRNVVLRVWLIATLVALLGLGGLATYGAITIDQTSLEYSKKIGQAKMQLEKDQFQATQKRVEEVTSSFKLAVRVLSQEVLFSQLLKQVATTIPANARLASLNIAQTKGAIDITAAATDHSTATQVQVNLSDPNNKIFSRADIVSINCEEKTDTSDDSSADPNYPCQVTIRALFAPNNPFLFINSKGKS